MRNVSLLVAGLSALAPAGAPGAGAQWPSRIKERIQQKVEQKADSLVDRGISCVVGDTTCVRKAQAQNKQVVITDSSGKALPKEQQQAALKAGRGAQQQGEAAGPNPGEGVWANYDFVPGERVLFKEDFTSERVGNFPHRLEFVTGNAEVVVWNGGRWLRSAGDPTIFAIPLPEVLPSRFTMEFQMTLPWWGAVIYGGPDGKATEPSASAREHSVINIDCCDVGVKNAGGEGGSTMDVRPLFDLGDAFTNHLFNFRVQGDGKYLKAYVEEKRIANIPNADFNRTNKIYFAIRAAGDSPNVMLGNLSINAGGTEMYEALSTTGRFATQGIFFDVDTDHLRPESTPTLNEIASMLKAHADLKIRIDGHTDNTGAAAHNQTLSEQRAAAVKKYLVEKAGIDAARLSSQGFGSTKPATTNDTPEGRQANRRVELVRL